MKPFITTRSGKHVNPLDMDFEHIDIEDIAHHLSLINRFNGATTRPISVAQHSVFVSLLAEKLAVVENDYSRRKIALQGLLHDASEAYLGDITKWLKQTWPIYNTAEQCLLGQILIKYKADTDVRPYQLHRYVEMADRFMVIYEGMEGEVPFWENTGPEYMQLDDIHWGIIHDLGWFFIDDFRDARSAFLDRFRALSLG